MTAPNPGTPTPGNPLWLLFDQYRRGEIDKQAFLAGVAGVGISAGVAVHMANSMPPPIREETWQEVRCDKCGRHLFDLADIPGNKGRKTCPKCKRLVVRVIPAQKAA